MLVLSGRGLVVLAERQTSVASMGSALGDNAGSLALALDRHTRMPVPM